MCVCVCEGSHGRSLPSGIFPRGSENTCAGQPWRPREGPHWTGLGPRSLSGQSRGWVSEAPRLGLEAQFPGRRSRGQGAQHLGMPPPSPPQSHLGVGVPALERGAPRQEGGRRSGLEASSSCKSTGVDPVAQPVVRTCPAPCGSEQPKVAPSRGFWKCTGFGVEGSGPAGLCSSEPRCLFCPLTWAQEAAERWPLRCGEARRKSCSPAARVWSRGTHSRVPCVGLGLPPCRRLPPCPQPRRLHLCLSFQRRPLAGSTGASGISLLLSAIPGEPPGSLWLPSLCLR